MSGAVEIVGRSEKLGEGVGVGCWKDLGKQVGREDWWWMDMGGEQWSMGEVCGLVSGSS
jgi:hypothetical protein